MQHHAPYQVWWSRGDGTHAGPRFRRLEDAIRYVNERASEASFAIKGPVGYWYQWQPGRAALERAS